MKDRYLKKLIWRKSMFLKNPVKRNWSYKSMAWESFSSPSAAFLKMWNHFMDLETVCHVVVKLPVLPKACVIPCWEKPGERENVISDCLWATVWEMKCSSSRWARLAGSELGRSHRAAEPLQDHVLLCLMSPALPFAHPGATDKQAAELCCTFNPCWLSFGAMLQKESWSLKGTWCKNPDYLKKKKKKVFEFVSHPALFYSKAVKFHLHESL